MHTHSSILHVVSLLSENTTFPPRSLPRLALHFSSFFFLHRSYSAESFPLETLRGRLVLYQFVCVLVCLWGWRAGREDFQGFLSLRRQPGIPSLSRRGLRRRVGARRFYLYLTGLHSFIISSITLLVCVYLYICDHVCALLLT